MTRLKLTLMALILAAPAVGFAQMNRVMTSPQHLPKPLVEKVIFDWFKRKYSEWKDSGREQRVMAAARQLCGKAAEANFLELMMHEVRTGELCLLKMDEGQIDGLVAKYLSNCTELVFLGVTEAGLEKHPDKLKMAIEILFNKVMEPEWKECSQLNGSSGPQLRAPSPGQSPALRERDF